MTNFNQIIDRQGTCSLKYDSTHQRNMPENILPMWVADMDFAAPAEVLTALHQAVDHGIFGYSFPDDHYLNTLKNWFQNRFKFTVDTDWVVTTPGIVFAISMAIRAFTQEGDAVIIQRPVYYPFSSAITKNHRKLINNPLIYADGSYTIDFEDFEQKIVDNAVKLFILCSPHNPVGRVWTIDELTRLGDICLKHDVLVVSDEIHADFVYSPHKHTIFGNVSDACLQNSIICTAPSKTFNIAGLQISNIFIADAHLRKAFSAEIARSGYCEPNIMALRACEAAYEYGAPWVDDLKLYLQENIHWVQHFLQENLPMLQLIIPEGTYLLWIDFRALGLSPEALNDFIIHRAGLWLDDGPIFGPEGSGFQRFNIACPKSTVIQAFTQLKDAIAGL